MKRVFGSILLGLIIISCKSKAILVEEKAVYVPVAIDSSALISDKIIQNQQSKKNNFSTLYIRANVKYKDEKKTLNVTAEIKIKKDEKILISMRFFGITMAKGLITPNTVKYYEKANGTYFDGDYKALSDWLGTDLDFDKVQNMLTGQPFVEIQTEKFKLKKDYDYFKLESLETKNTLIAYFFDIKNMDFIKQQITQKTPDRGFQVNYPKREKHDELEIPLQLDIEAKKEENKTNIFIEYNNITFGEKLTFPYSVPEGYERILIN